MSAGAKLPGSLEENVMKRFVWRLQRVLDVKKIEEKTKEAELMRLTETLAERQGELIMLRRSLAELAAQISKKEGTERLKEQEHFLRWSEGADEKAKQKEKIAEVVKARRFREGLEKLREKAKGQFVKEAEKLEQKELDEAGAVGFVRNSRDEEKKEQELSLQYQETGL
jgi:flagellar biosynthesis chaperone FliJ